MAERAEVFERMKSLAAETLEKDIDEIEEDSHFADDLEADSLDLVELVMSIEEAFSIEIPEQELENVETVGQVLDLVMSKGPSVA